MTWYLPMSPLAPPPWRFRGQNYFSVLPEPQRSAIRACVTLTRETQRPQTVAIESVFQPHDRRIVECVPGRRTEVMVIVYAQEAENIGTNERTNERA